MATIKDVARRAGVSSSTVSYALSGKRSISDETRARIAEAIEELGFTPHAGARALATAHTHVLGLLAHFYDDEFSPAMLQYILPIIETARSFGYDTLVVTDPDGRASLERISASNMIDGVVLLNVADDDPRLGVLRRLDTPAALVGLPHDTRGVDVFDLDFAAAARLLVAHLAEQGHDELILVTPHQHVFDRGGAYAWRFRDAALQRAAESGMRVRLFAGETRKPALDDQLDEILTAAEGRALVVHNDAIIAALPPALHARGLRAPDHLSVAGIYSDDFGHEFSLPFTAVESSPGTLGRLAVESLVARLSPGGSPTTRVDLVAPFIVDRGSTGPRARTDR